MRRGIPAAPRELGSGAGKLGKDLRPQFHADRRCTIFLEAKRKERERERQELARGNKTRRVVTRESAVEHTLVFAVARASAIPIISGEVRRRRRDAGTGGPFPPPPCQATNLARLEES